MREVRRKSARYAKRLARSNKNERIGRHSPINSAVREWKVLCFCYKRVDSIQSDFSTNCSMHPSDAEAAWKSLCKKNLLKKEIKRKKPHFNITKKGNSALDEFLSLSNSAENLKKLQVFEFFDKLFDEHSKPME